MVVDLVLSPRSQVGQVGTFPLREGTFTLGRSSDCDFVIPDITVSRRHAEITVANGSVTVCDLGSRNGTYVDEERVRESCLLQPLQHLRVGSVVFSLTSAPTAGEPDASELETEKCADSMNVQTIALKLSPAQNRVLNELLEGSTDKEIAKSLCISPNTVHCHVQAILQAFAVHSRAELLACFVHKTVRKD
jgi:pSer/pThr/pTyr-binding forkhead associated (FHA) protein